jgi:hypothetical protein
MSHRIKIIENFISEQDCQYAISLLKQFAQENKLEIFKDNPKVRVAPETKEVIEFNKKFSVLCCEEHRSSSGFKLPLFTTEAFLSLWAEGSDAGVHLDSHYGYEFLQFTSVLYFNNDYQGGEIYFPNQQIVIRPKAGSAILFPSGGTEYPHGVKEITSGVRATLAMWHTGRIDKASESLNPGVYI